MNLTDKKREETAVTDTEINKGAGADLARITNDDIILSTDEVCAVIEAVLFAAGYAVTYDKLAKTTGYPVSIIKKIAAAHADEFNDKNKGLLMLTYENSCQLCTRENLSGFVRDALGIKRGGNLSQSSIEVLAIIAYNEPTTRAFVDTVRGVDSGYAVASLVDKHLLETCGRVDAPGRPFLYRTTPDFLRCFGISSLAELPDVDIPRPGEQIAMKPSNESDFEHGEAE